MDGFGVNQELAKTRYNTSMQPRRMKLPIIYTVTALICLALVSSNAQVNEQVTTNWFKLDAGPFSILAPSGWEFHQSQGVDSYVGEFVGDGVSLRFDFGRYSSELKEAKEPEHTIIHKSIGGFRAKMVSPRAAGHGVTGVYFKHVAGPNALCLWGQDLTEAQQNLVLRVFETVRFGHGQVPGPIPPPANDAR